MGVRIPPGTRLPPTHLLKTRSRIILLLLAALLAFGALVWLVQRDPKIAFLSGDKRAQWILFPNAIDTGTHPIVNLDTRFRREFELTRIPNHAHLLIRAMRECELKINDGVVELPASQNWKKMAVVDVTGVLRAGANKLEARVFNSNGPPALWLALETDESSLGSDENWEASFTGSAWRRAALATTPRFPQEGNIAAGGETIRQVWPGIWPTWLLLTVAGALFLFVFHWCQKRKPARAGDVFVKALLVLISALWLALFWNNTRQIPFAAGFDFRAHPDYIQYIQDRHALPLPNEGFEMYQPPLYYVISAAALSSFRSSVVDPAGVTILRALTMLFGLAHIILIFLTMRLLFPGRWAAQAVGLVVAAFLPLQIYLSHYVTNEMLSATLMAATVYLALRLLGSPEWPIAEYAGLGVTLGAALLAKSTAVLLIPLLLAAFVAKIVRQRTPFTIYGRALGLATVLCFLVGGWYYARIWRELGQPLVGNWDLESGFAWWQDPGFRTAADYWRFGRALSSPFYSALNGFADGYYATLWGDGLWGGVSDLPSRPPWNYGLMTGGYLLALLPTLLILAGVALALARCLRRPQLSWLLLLGLFALILSGTIFMTLKIAAYGQIKAIYGMSILIALSSFAALAWDRLMAGRPKLQFALGVLLFVWAANSFASMWIRDSVALQVYRATKFRSQHEPESALADAERAVRLDPSNSIAHRCLSLALGDENRAEEAMSEAERAVQLAPHDSAAHTQLSARLAKEGLNDRAIEEARHALEFGPENVLAWAILLPSLVDLNRNQEAIEAAREALGVVGFNPEAHYLLGLASGRRQDFETATDQFVYALLLRPGWEDARLKLHAAVIGLSRTAHGVKYVREISRLAAESPIILNDLAWVLATNPDARVRSGEDAVRLAEQAYGLPGGADHPAIVITLAAAYAETGKFPEAIDKAEQALAVARASGNEAMIQLSSALLESFRAMQPYRQN